MIFRAELKLSKRISIVRVNFPLLFINPLGTESAVPLAAELVLALRNCPFVSSLPIVNNVLFSSEANCSPLPPGATAPG